MTINPAVRDREYSTWAEDNTAMMAEARDKALAALEQAKPFVDMLANNGSPLSAYTTDPPGALIRSWHGHDAEELAEFLEAILEGDREKAHDLDLERFQEEVG